MNISEQLTLLQNIKESIKQSITNKGVEIFDNTPFSDYAELIDAIKTGGRSIYEQKDKSSIEIFDSINMRTGIYTNKDNTVINLYDYINGKNEIFQHKDKASISLIDKIKGKTGNYIAIGNLINDNEILSGFSTNSYILGLKKIDLSAANNWEIGLNFTTGSQIYNQETIWGAGTNASAGGSCGFVIDIYQNNLRFITALYDNQPSRGISLIYPMTINTEYRIKAKFTGTEYQLYVNDNLEASITSSQKGLYNSSLNQNFVIGACFNGDTPISGSIDLSSCYININNENYWLPRKGTEQIL